MGCSQGKTTAPLVTNKYERPARPGNTLLGASVANGVHKPSNKAMVPAETWCPAIENSSRTTDAEIALKGLFHRMDTDRNGTVDAHEVAAALRQNACLTATLEKAGYNSKWYVLEQLDTNGDGKITWQEFKTSLMQSPASRKSSASKELQAGSRTEAATKPCALRSKALRIFIMMDVDMDARIHTAVLLMLLDRPSSRQLQKVLELDSNALLSQTEWLQVVRKAADRDHHQVASLLDLCLTRLETEHEDWPLRKQALEVFRVADRNGDGQIDIHEMAEMRRSSAFETQMVLSSMDLDKNGTISKGEWLAYIKRLADEDQECADAILRAYKKRLLEASIKISPASDAEEVATCIIDEPILEDSTGSANAGRPWWACC